LGELTCTRMETSLLILISLMFGDVVVP
jgi:hypothetical protein